MKKNTLLCLGMLLPFLTVAQHTFTNNGANVGIGTTSPVEKLHIENGRLYLNSGVSVDGWRYNYFYWSGHSLVMGSRPGAYSHNILQLMPGGSNLGPVKSMLQVYAAPRQDSSVLKVQLDAEGTTFFNGGNVGINTSTPTASLEVRGATLISGGADLTLKAPETSAFDAGDVVFTGNNNTEFARIYTKTGGADLRFSVGATPSPKMVITDAGNVGIGILSPTAGYKLAVNGTIGARRVKVTQETWADFVFHPGYKLPPLSEVENYIKANGHLPGIPAAEIVKKEGLDLGEMNRQLLQKVEELTLYIIAQKKQLDELKKANQTQYEMLNAVQQEVHKLKAPR